MVSASSLHTMITANLNEYGMGLFIRNANKHELITHDGSIDGFESSLNYYPERQLTIVVLGNVRTDAPGKIAAQLGKVAFGERWSSTPIAKLYASILPFWPDTSVTTAHHPSLSRSASKPIN